MFTSLFLQFCCNYGQLIGKFDKFDSCEKKNQGIGLPVDACLAMAFSSVYIADNLYVAINQYDNKHYLLLVLMQASYRKIYRYTFQSP
jgi:hypothetical protein